jgi:protein-S-isoprenylcysteine O-methyltransferase Ste14
MGRSGASCLGLLLASLRWGPAFRSWVGVLLTALTVPPLVARMDAEEALFASQFGDGYEAYRKGTWRLVPHV